MDRPLAAIAIIVLTVISGLSDAAGALYASQMWQDGRLDWGAFARSALGFGFGISMYWIAVRFMREVGIVAPEVQTTIWFGVMIIGVALLSGAFLRWRLADQVVAILVVIGIGYLSFRTSA